MAQTGPASQLRGSDADGMLEVAVKDGAANVADQPLLPAAGTNGTVQKQITTDDDGNQKVVGIGVAGTPTGGVLTVQGDPAGTPIPVTSTEVKANTSTITRVPAAIVDTLILAANAARLGVVIVNDSNRILYLKLKATAATVIDYTFKMAPDDRVMTEDFAGYDGEVRGIWSVGVVGAAQVTELTA
jgi:hypothetical protein